MTSPTHIRRRALEAELRELRRQARPKRPKSPKADRGRVRDNGYLAFLRRQPCSIEGLRGHVCEGRIEAAHIRTARPGELPTGLQRKPDDERATSLCSLAHREQHSMQEMRFWRSYNLDPFEVAAKQRAEYLGDGGVSRPLSEGNAVPRNEV